MLAKFSNKISSMSFFSVKNPPLSSVLAKNERINVVTSVDLVYQEMQRVR